MQRVAAGILIGLALFACDTTADAAPKAEPWPRWERHDAASTQTVDHKAWDAFLRSYVVASPDRISRIAYAHVVPADRAALAAYLDRLAAVPVDGLNRAEQRAFWINLYNALTVRLVLDRYPVSSIRAINITPGFLSIGPWGRKLIKVAGEELSLDDIEHRILRPIWRDPRLHYAVNCASLGCPDLVAEAFTAANTERLLDEGARAYINHPRGVRIAGGRLHVSSIYVWFREDFGGTDAGVIEHLRRHADAPLVAALTGRNRIDSDSYDWALNDAR